LCLAYALGHQWITSVAVGAETVEQVRENADLAALPPLSTSECDAVRAEIAPGSRALLDQNWPPL
ncbi:MAG: aldo/keto reductase, partial [Sporichthyaceae bacterium]